MPLRLEAELSPVRWAELGRPRAAFLRADGACAIASAFDGIYWPGRAVSTGHRLRERVCIYAPDLARRWAVCDAATFPVNDVAFHPTEPWVAVATGRYDGGYFFEGELWLWNWETSACFRLLSENRDVTRVRYLDGGRLAVLMHPRNEEDVDGSAFDTYFGGIVDDLRGHEQLGMAWGERDPRLESFSPVEPASLGFDAGELGLERGKASLDAVVPNYARLERHRVWDVAWLDDEHVAAVHDNCLAEVWHVSGQLVWEDRRDDRHGVQILRQGGRSLVHVIKRDKTPPGSSASCLMELRGEGLHAWREFEHIPLMSADSAGRLLCRSTKPNRTLPAPPDSVIVRDGSMTPVRLGHFDCINHSLRVDGADMLYFLRGTPPSSYQRKELCGLDQQGEIRSVFPWDEATGGHLVESQACRLPEGGWIRIAHRCEPGGGTAFVDRLDEQGAVLWRRPIESVATALVSLPSDPTRVVYALLNGDVGVLDTRHGESLTTQPLQVDGVSSMALSLSARGERLAMGTIDGRVLLWRLDASH